MVSIKFKTIEDFRKDGAAERPVSGIHSGNAGDVIYSLPTVQKLGIRHLILNVYRDPNPLRSLTEQNARALVPLLLAQEYLDRVTLVSAGVPLNRSTPSRSMWTTCLTASAMKTLAVCTCCKLMPSLPA